MQNNENKILSLEPLVFTDKRAANEMRLLLESAIAADNHHLVKLKVRIHSNMRVVSIRAYWGVRKLYCRAHKCSVALEKFMIEIRDKVFNEIQTKDWE